MSARHSKTGLAVLAVALMFTMTACSPAAARPSGSQAPKTEGTLTWYTDDDAQEVGPVIQEFTKETGIEVVLLATADVVPKVTSESASHVHTADIISFSGPPNVLTLEKAGDLAKLPAAVKSALPKQNSAFLSKDGDWFANEASFWGVFYNTQNVDAAHAPTNFHSFLDPYWKGKFSIPISTNNTSIEGYYQLAKAPGFGKSFLTALGKNQPVSDADSGQQVSDVIVGNQLGGITNDNAAWAEIAAGAPLKFIYPSDGTTESLKYNALVKGAPHPAAATAFLKFLVSKKAAELLSKATGKLSLFPGITSIPADRPAIGDIQYLPAPDPQTLVNALPTMAPFLKSAFNE